MQSQEGGLTEKCKILMGVLKLLIKEIFGCLLLFCIDPFNTAEAHTAYFFFLPRVPRVVPLRKDGELIFHKPQASRAVSHERVAIFNISSIFLSIFSRESATLILCEDHRGKSRCVSKV